MTDHLIAAYEEDIRIRAEGLEHLSPDGERVSVHEMTAGIIYDSAGVRVTAFLVQHGSWAEAYGFRIDTPDRSIALSGDTSPGNSLVDMTRGVDALVHEGYPELRLAPEKRPGAEAWPHYMREFHSSDVELGALAAKIEPKLLPLKHTVRIGGTDEELLAGVRRSGFNGRVAVGHDLERC